MVVAEDHTNGDSANNEKNESQGVKPGVFASIFLSGVASVIAVNFIHPIELVKSRIQVTGLGIFTTARGLVETEGYAAFFKGIQVAWIREGTYTAIKMGAYAPVRDALAGEGNTATVVQMLVAGCVTGAAGAAVSNPFDLLKTMQMNNESSKPPALGQLAKELYRDQGWGGFYRGLSANGKCCEGCCELTHLLLSCCSYARLNEQRHEVCII
jgi:hypothetical protein